MALYTSEHIAELQGGRVAQGRCWSFHFASATVRLWNGHTDRTFNGHVYQGFRGMIQAPSFPLSRKPQAERGEFVVRGLPSDIEKIVWNHDHEVVGRVIVEHEFLMRFDDLTVIGEAHFVGQYFMRYVKSVTSGASIEGGAPTYDLSLGVENLWSARSQTSAGRYTPADQAARYPGLVDRGLDETGLLASGLLVKF